MSAEAFLESVRGLADQLLAGANPRCFWTEGARYANPAFEANFPPDFRPPDDLGICDVGGFRCTFTRVHAGAECGVFIDAVPLAPPAFQPLLSSLPEIVRYATKPDPGIADVHHFMEALARTGGQLFSGSLLFFSRDWQSFVLVRETGETLGNPRSWMRWPLNRLFVNQRACVITNPLEDAYGLAVPFAVGPGRRYVVVAPLRMYPAPLSAEKIFIESLENLTLDVSDKQKPVRAYALDSIQTEPIAASPKFVWFGSSGALRDKTINTIVRRGWQVDVAGSFAELLQRVEDHSADVVLLDGSGPAASVAMLRAIRHASGAWNVPIVYFHEGRATAELEVLVELRLHTGAKAAEVFKTIKDAVRLVPQRRSKALRIAAADFRTSLALANDCTDLAHALALAARELAGDWAAATLVDHSGNVYSSEVPTAESPLLDSLPLGLLGGYAVMRSRLGEDFFAEITDNPDTTANLRSLGALSGASIPIAEGGRIVGTLVVLSCKRQMFEPEFEALADLADFAAPAFAEVQTRLLRKQAASRSEWPAWEELVVGDCRLDGYRGWNAPECARIAALDFMRAAICCVFGEDPETSYEIAERALAELATIIDRWEDPADAIEAVVSAFKQSASGILVGIVNAQESAFTYAAERCPAPLRIPINGPSAVLESGRRFHRGSIPIRTRTATLLYGPYLAEHVESAALVQAVQTELHRDGPNPLSTVPALSGDPARIAFVGITRRSFGAERPDWPGSS